MISLINIKNTNDYTLYIGRENSFYNLERSKWANPFLLKEDTVENRKIIAEQYKEYVLNNKDLMSSLHELENQTLACFCFPKLCHGNVLIQLYYENRLNNLLADCV